MGASECGCFAYPSSLWYIVHESRCIVFNANERLKCHFLARPAIRQGEVVETLLPQISVEENFKDFQPTVGLICTQYIK